MNQVSIAVDATGGDHGIDMIVEAVQMALAEEPNIVLTLFGDKPLIESKLKENQADQQRIQIIHAPECIDNNESPVVAIRQKKEASIVKGLHYVKEGHAKAFVSAGSTGAVLAGGTLIIGRIKGVSRPALGSFIPTKKGVSLLMDCGANVDSKPAYLHQFAVMGASYSEGFTGKSKPTVGLLNVGTEEKKGNNLTKETYGLLKADTSLNFIGNIEGRDIAMGEADVIIADGFAGNLLLKHTEGLALFLFGEIKQAMMSTWYSKIGALLIKKPLKKRLQGFDYTEYGGAPLLGLEGLVVKAHGSSNAKAFKNAILQCKTFSEQKINEKIKQQFIK